MIPFECQLLLAVLLDLLLGDPAWFPHPVRLMGKLATTLERFFRWCVRNQYLAGLATFAAVTATTAGAALGIVYGAYRLHPAVGDGVVVFLLYTTIAIRDMLRHSVSVCRALKANNLEEARRWVGRIVGRDTEQLDEAGVVRATVESVAESLIDGIAAPLFYAALAGPVGAMTCKAISTLDSMFGHRNEKYRKFGWVSARSDDVANFLPARLAAPLVPLAASVLWLHPVRSLKTILRDRKKHPSPNAGHAEAAVAGALGIQLGGLNYYEGQPSARPIMGDRIVPLGVEHIEKANSLLLVSSVLLVGLSLGLHFLLRTVSCGGAQAF